MTRRRYPPEFYKQRKRVLLRDMFRCVMCWRRWHLDVHHYPYTQSYALEGYEDEDLMTLCDSCHGKAATAQFGSPFMQTLQDLAQKIKSKAYGSVSSSPQAP